MNFYRASRKNVTSNATSNVTNYFLQGVIM